MVLHREHLVKAAQVVQLVDATLVDLASELLASHLIPKQGRLLVHFLELAVPNYPIQVFLAVSLRHAQNLEGVLDHRLLDPVIEPAVRLEGGRLVDLEEPRFGVSVDEHVEAEHFKAHVKRAIVRLAGAIIVQKVGLARYERLYDQICDFKLEQVHINAIVCQTFVHSLQCALRARAIFNILIGDSEIRSILVNCIVRQMCLLWHFALVPLLQAIRLRCKSGNAFFVPENGQWVARGD